MMEMATISLPCGLKQEVDSYVEELGITWTELLETIIGCDPSPSVAKAILEAEASGTGEKKYATTKEMFDDILGADWNT